MGLAKGKEPLQLMNMHSLIQQAFSITAGFSAIYSKPHHQSNPV